MLRKLPGGLLRLLGGLEARQQRGGAANPPGAARCGEPGGAGGVPGRGARQNRMEKRGAAHPCPARPVPPGGAALGRTLTVGPAPGAALQSWRLPQAAVAAVRPRAAGTSPAAGSSREGITRRPGGIIITLTIRFPQEPPGFSRDAGEPLARENRRGGPGVPAPRRILPGSRSGASSPGAGGALGALLRPGRTNSIVPCTAEPPEENGSRCRCPWSRARRERSRTGREKAAGEIPASPQKRHTRQSEVLN